MAGSLLLFGKVPQHTYRSSNRFSLSSDPITLESVSCSWIRSRGRFKDNLQFKEVLFSGQSVRCYRLKPVSCLGSKDTISQVVKPELKVDSLLFNI